MGQMNTAFRNSATCCTGFGGVLRDANNYESQEQASQQILSSKPTGRSNFYNQEDR